MAKDNQPSGPEEEGGWQVKRDGERRASPRVETKTEDGNEVSSEDVLSRARYYDSEI